MQRLDDSSTEQYLKITIAGENGTGKTWAGTTAPDPLILVFERQAVASVRASCAVRGIQLPMMLLVESVEDCGNVLRAFQGDKAQPFVVRDKVTKETLVELPRWPQTLVVDSITDACDKVRSELVTWEAPPKKDAETGLADESFAHRRTYEDRSIQLIKAFRNAPAHVVFLCLLDEKTIWRQRREVGRQWLYNLPTKNLQSPLMAACNVCGMIYRRKGQVGVLLEGDAIHPTKNIPPLRRQERPNISQWIQRIQGTWAGDLPTAPPEPEDVEEVALVARQEEAQIEGKDPTALPGLDLTADKPEEPPSAAAAENGKSGKKKRNRKGKAKGKDGEEQQALDVDSGAQ